MENRSQPTSAQCPSGARRPGQATSPGPPGTLLVFTLGPRRESRRRRLLPPAQKSLEDGLHQACLDAALAAGRAAGLRLEVSSPLDLPLPADVERRRQRGSGFGARLESALEQAFAEGGGPVVLVGSDAPDLEASHLRRTLDLLDARPDRVVVGPSPDGGFYLLASRRPLGAALSRVRWRCRRTLRSLQRALLKQGLEVVLLAPLIDLDRRADLERWLARAPWRGGVWRGLIRRLAAALAELRRRWRPVSRRLPARRELRVHRLRGPPLPA